MSLTVDRPKAARWPRITVAILASLALLAGMGWAVVTGLYAPPGHGSFSGVSVESMKRLTNGIEDTGIIVTDSPAVLKVSLRNDGPLPVRVEGVDFANPMFSFTWGPFMSPRDNLAGGHPDETRRLPATIPPGEEIALWITVTKPPCTPGIGAGLSHVRLKWSVLGRGRTHDLALEDVGGPLHTCYPDTALKHVQTA